MNPETDPIIQVAAIAVDANLETLEEVEMKLLFTPSLVPKEVLDINHYTPEAWVKAVSVSDACNQLSSFMKRYADVRMVSKRTGKPYFVAQMVGHNAAGFDGLFLKAMYQRLDLFMPASYRVLDTLQRAMWHFHEAGIVLESYGLKELCDYFRHQYRRQPRCTR